MWEHKREFKAACDVAEAAFPMLDIDQTEVIFSARREAHRFDLAMAAWCRRPAREVTGVRWEMFTAATMA